MLLGDNGRVVRLAMPGLSSVERLWVWCGPAESPYASSAFKMGLRWTFESIRLKPSLGGWHEEAPRRGTTLLNVVGPGW